MERTTPEILEALRASEEFKTRMIECSRDCIKVLDLDGRLLSMNAGGMEILEICDLAPFLNSSWIDFWQGEDREHARAAVEAARAGRVGRFVGYFPGQQTGKPMWWDVVVNAILDAEGRPERLLALSRDATDLKRAEEVLRKANEELERRVQERTANLAQANAALRENEARLGAIIDSALDAIIVVDDEGIIRLFNPAAENVFRCAAADAVGTPVARFSTPASAESLRQAWADIRAGVKSFSITEAGLKSRRADGEEFEFEGTLSCAQVGGQRLWTITIRDLDERRQLEAEQSRLKQQSAYLQEEIKATHNFEEIVGQSRALTAVLAQVELVAATGSTVLVLGETGTGKELVARAIHARGTRRDRPLIKVNCGALPGGLIESELFGHERGAFTGANERRIGRFELAHGGTIFLDELGDMPPEVQVKLLRVLQEQEFERVGGSATVKADVRVIAATNRDLTKAVAERKFRQDLYYRLNVFPVHLPPLRERVDDIPLLVHFFVARYAAKIGRSISRVPQDTMRRFMTYNWPGNVRELENVIERAMILSAGPDLHVPAEMLATLPAAQPRVAAPPPVEQAAAVADATGLKELERTHILSVLKRTNWRIDGPQGAAGILKMNPSTLRSRMKKLGIQRNADVVS